MESNTLNKIIIDDPELQAIAGEMINKYIENLKIMDARASGNLMDTARYDLTADGSHILLYFDLQEYWYYLENGPRPHFPPISAIEKWIQIKGIQPVQRGRQKPPTLKQLAFAICKSMERGKRDTDGQLKAYISRPAIRYMINDNKDLVDKFINRIAEIYAEKTQKEIQLVFSTWADRY